MSGEQNGSGNKWGGENEKKKRGGGGGPKKTIGAKKKPILQQTPDKTSNDWKISGLVEKTV